MRLVCPNCEAKYEVPEDAIPETGRDVQCANCGHAWYQMRSRAPLAETTSVPVVAPAAATAHDPLPEPARDPAIAAERATVSGTNEDAGMAAGPMEEPSPEEASVAEAVASKPADEPASAVDVVASVEEPAAVVAETEVSVVGDVSEEAFGGDAPAAVDASVDDVAETAPSLETPVEISAEVPALTEEVAAVASVGAVPAIEAAVVESVVAEEAAETAVQAETEELTEVAATSAAPAAYAVDESVLAILREEAEREVQARRAEAAKPLETQTDLGIETAIPSKPVEIAAVIAAETTRRTRLPDVEEINSTLRPTETAVEEGMAMEAAPAESRSSFRSGFLLVMTVAILGSALYGSADALAAAVPSLAGPLKAYVGFVDSLRLHLDGLMQSATVAINGT